MSCLSRRGLALGFSPNFGIDMYFSEIQDFLYHMFSISEELNKKVDNDIGCQFFSLSLHNKKLRSLIRQLSATMNYCLNLLTIELTINCHLFFLFLQRKKGLPLYAAFREIDLLFESYVMNQFCHSSFIFHILRNEKVGDTVWYI